MASTDDPTVPLLSSETILPNDHTINHNYNYSSTNLESCKIERCTQEYSETYRQLIQAFLVALACAFDAQQCFITVFTDATTSTATTTVTEWDLETSSSFIRGLPTSAFFIGSVTGGFLLSTLADSVLGRKTLLLLCTLTLSISSILAAFSPNVLVYSALRFICGFGRSPIVTCTYVLCTELVEGKRQHSYVAILGFAFAMGFLSLSPIAYLNRNTSWRDIYLWTSVPALAYCVVVHFFVHESPRWLLVRGREKEEASETLQIHISEAPYGSDEEQGGGGGTEGYDDNSNNNRINRNKKDDSNRSGDAKSIFSAMRILVSRGWSLRRILAVTIINFGIGLIYYGMPLGLSSLPVNLYISVAINAIAEIPSSLIMLLFIGKMDRRHWLLGASVLSGSCSFLVAVAVHINGGSGLQVGLELVSFAGGVMAVNMALMHTTELFPTCVRSSALSIARQALVLGGACAPFLVAAGENNQFLSYGVFGGVVVFCGLFSLCLPETRGAVLCDTMDEEEEKRCDGLVD